MKITLVSLVLVLAGCAAALPKPPAAKPKPPHPVPMADILPGKVHPHRRGAGTDAAAATNTTTVTVDGPGGGGGDDEEALAARGAAAGPKNECIPKSSFLFDKYTVHGVGFAYLGAGGERLEHELRGCAGFGGFAFARGRFGAADQYTWEATFRHTLLQRTCVGHALQTLGGQKSSCYN